MINQPITELNNQNLNIEKKKNKWSWDAFFFASSWLCYLKMYSYAFLYSVFELLIPSIVTISLVFFEKASFVLPVIVALWALMHICFGCFGEKIHSYWLKKKEIEPNLAPRSLMAFVFMPMLIIIFQIFLIVTISWLTKDCELITKSFQTLTINNASVLSNTESQICIQIGNNKNEETRASKIDEIESLLNNVAEDKKNYLVAADCAGFNGFIQTMISGKENGKSFYNIEYKDPQAVGVMYSSEKGYDLEMTSKIFKKYYLGDASYKNDIKWEKLIYSDKTQKWEPAN